MMVRRQLAWSEVTPNVFRVLLSQTKTWWMQLNVGLMLNFGSLHHCYLNFQGQQAIRVYVLESSKNALKNIAYQACDYKTLQKTATIMIFAAILHILAIFSDTYMCTRGLWYFHMGGFCLLLCRVQLGGCVASVFCFKQTTKLMALSCAMFGRWAHMFLDSHFGSIASI